MKINLQPSLIHHHITHLKSPNNLTTHLINSHSPHKSNQQTILVKNPLEEVQLLNNLIWRQKTTMPIVKVIDFNSLMNEHTYPKIYNIQTQPIDQPLSFLRNIEIKSALYLIWRCAFGVQALMCKYTTFDINKIFYCLTKTGQCKVWITQKLWDHHAPQSHLPSQTDIILHIIKTIQTLCDKYCKYNLQQLFRWIYTNKNINFNLLYNQLSSFAKIKNIVIPKIYPYKYYNNKNQLIKCQLNKLRSLSKNHIKYLTPYKINFKHQSTQNKYHSKPETHLLHKKFNHIKKQLNSKPKVIFNYQNTNTGQKIISPRRINSAQRKRCNSPHPLSVDRRHLPNQTLLAKYPSSKSHQQQPNIQNNKQQNKCIKSCASIVFQNDQQTNYNQDFQKLLSYRTKQRQNYVKNSLSTTYQSSSYSIIIKGQNQKTHKQLQNQNKDHKNFCSSSSPYLSSYNFGGLFPLPQSQLKKSHQLNDPHLQPQLSTPIKTSIFFSPPPTNDQLFNSIILTQQKQIATRVHDWKNKMINLLDDDQNLKQSVYCGQQKKYQQQPLIKLDLLQKFGRNIKGSNFIQDNNIQI